MRRIAVLLALLAVVAVTPAKAALQLPLGRQTSTNISTTGGSSVLAQKGVQQIRCVLTLNGRFSGVRNASGVVSGTWYFAGSTSCNVRPIYLSVKAFLFRGPYIIDSSAPSQCYACPAVGTSKVGSCSYCNGNWTIRTDHRIDFPAGSVLVSVPKECTSFLNTISCVLSAPAYIA